MYNLPFMFIFFLPARVSSKMELIGWFQVATQGSYTFCFVH